MKEIKEMIKRHEGFRGKPYLCSAGKQTIGFGRNIDDVGFSLYEREYLDLNKGRDFNFVPMTVVEACFVFENDYLTALNMCFSLDVDFEGLDDARKGVLIDMMFNLGFARLSKFKNTLRYIKERRFNDAACEMLNSRWARQVTRRANELSKIMETGEF